MIWYWGYHISRRHTNEPFYLAPGCRAACLPACVCLLALHRGLRQRSAMLLCSALLYWEGDSTPHPGLAFSLTCLHTLRDVFRSPRAYTSQAPGSCWLPPCWEPRRSRVPALLTAQHFCCFCFFTEQDLSCFWALDCLSILFHIFIVHLLLLCFWNKGDASKHELTISAWQKLRSFDLYC